MSANDLPCKVATLWHLRFVIRASPFVLRARVSTYWAFCCFVATTMSAAALDVFPNRIEMQGPRDDPETRNLIFNLPRGIVPNASTCNMYGGTES
jgi:hypothetical protein